MASTSVGSLSSSGQYINIDALVNNAVRVQQKRLTDLQSQQSSTNTKISTLGTVKSQISSLEDKFNAISKALTNVSVTGVQTGVNVTASGNGTYAVSVDSLASSQIITYKSGVSKEALGYSGTLKIDTGSYDNSNNFTIGKTGVNVEIVATDTLSDIAKKINNSNSDISASIINGEDGQHLSFSNAIPGATNGFKISTVDTGSTGIGALNYEQGNTSNYNEIQQAKDGKATVNGIVLSSSDNNFKATDTFSFSATQTATMQNINVKRDDSAITKAITEFVNAYNVTGKNLKNADIDNSLKNFTTTLRQTLSKVDYDSTISHIGLSFDKNGSLSFDSSKFSQYGATNPAGLSNLIKTQFSITSAGTKLFNSIDDSGGVIDSKIEALNKVSSKLINTVSDAQTLLATQKQNYQIQFAKVDQYLAQLNDNSNTVAALVKQFSTTA